jgi:hypothetical protein
MSSQRPFGRRALSQLPAPRAVARAATPVADKAAEEIQAAAILLDAHAADADIDREIDDWKTMRKIKKRSFREPWRSVSIAAGIGFGAGSWLLPDSVSTLVQLVTAGLALASFAAGYRRRP